MTVLQIRSQAEINKVNFELLTHKERVIIRTNGKKLQGRLYLDKERAVGYCAGEFIDRHNIECINFNLNSTVIKLTN